MYRAVRAVVVVTVLMLGGAACGQKVADTDGRKGLGKVPATELGFVRHGGAVEWPAVSDWIPQGQGLRRLLPVGGCVLGIGTFQNGFRAVGVNWTGNEACDRLKLDPAPGGSDAGGDRPAGKGGGWAGGGVGGDGFVVEDGGVLAAGGSGLYRFRDGELQELARIDLSAAGFEGQGSRSLVSGMVRTGSGRIIVNADLTTKPEQPPAVLVSDDAGVTLRRVDLPAAPRQGRAQRQLLAVLAADGDTVVAIGYGWDQPGAWRSTDGGRTWQVSTVDGLPASLMLTRLVRAGDRWLAFGGVEGGAQQDSTLVLTSTDGLTWTRGTTEGMGAGRVSDVTVDQDGTVVVAGVIDDSRPHKADERNDYCGVVWIGDGAGAWQRGELGCGDAPPQAVATLRDGRVLITGNRDLWLRVAA
ncbi:WD40/YVTN/BNR-like repeat-containing protein [Dactylosporangium sp. NPDC000521]|uniref:WD40/YVTN/BNR-like repeat-containing protein n=1 Tax=Dactylosporangium sp. NPDC000521 TaxID=3363975 RepID=UPI0036C53D28